MPAVTVEAEHLKRCIAAVKAVVPSRSTIPILSCVRIAVADGVMTFDATDLDRSIRMTVPAHGDGAWCIDYAKLSAMLSVVPDGAAVGIDGTTSASIRSGKISARISSLDPNDWPAVSAVIDNPEWQFTIGAKAFKDAIARVSPARFRDRESDVLAGIHMTVARGKMQIEACNRYVGLRVPLAVDCLRSVDVIMPGEISNSLAAIPDGVDVEVSRKAGTLCFAAPGVTLASKMIDGEYPQIDRAIGVQRPIVDASIFDAASLSAAVKAAGAGQTWDGEEITIKVDGESAYVIGSGTAGNDITIPVECECRGDFTARFNPGFILAMVAASKRSTLALTMSDVAMLCLDQPETFSGLVMTRRGAPSMAQAA